MWLFEVEISEQAWQVTIVTANYKFVNYLPWMAAISNMVDSLGSVICDIIPHLFDCESVSSATDVVLFL